MTDSDKIQTLPLPFLERMKEMLGENNEYGIVVANEDIELYKAIKDLVKNPEKILYYKQQAEFRGNYFSTEGTVKKVEEMIENL